jgi:hypothetical protein
MLLGVVGADGKRQQRGGASQEKGAAVDHHGYSGGAEHRGAGRFLQ